VPVLLVFRHLKNTTSLGPVSASVLATSTAIAVSMAALRYFDEPVRMRLARALDANGDAAKGKATGASAFDSGSGSQP
jgi:hypothetical protein